MPQDAAPTMNTQKWTSQIDQITGDFKQSFAGLTAEELNWQPNPGRWSIAQNMDHLIVVNSTYFTVVDNIRKGTYKVPFVGKLNFMVSFFGKLILNAVQPEAKRKTKTFPLWEPSQSNIGSDILDRFAKHQENLKKLIEGCADLLEKKTVISSPANRNIVYTLETAFDIIIAHERRHLQQAMAILNVF